MSSVLLALVLGVLSPASVTAYTTWDEISWEYAVPPLSLGWAPSVGGSDSYALEGGTDAQGRAVVTFSAIMARLSPLEIRKTTAHEAAHAMLRAQGIPYGGIAEENLANAFAYCWLRDPVYVPLDGTVGCAQVLRMFPAR